MKVVLVFNPKAAHGRTEKILPQIENEFNRKGILFDLKTTDYPEHATELLAQINFDDYDGVVAAGGDGTLFEVINGFYKNKSKKRIPLGILPIGTGNAFARDLELTTGNWKEAIDIISKQNVRDVDVGRFSTHGQTYYFLNILGLGFVADVTEIAHKLKIFGNVSYTLGVLFRTIFLKSHNLKITIDGRVIEDDNIFVEVSNTTYTSNFLMAPEAKIDDGLLDITLLKKLSRRRLLQCFPKIFTGEHVLMDEIDTFTAKKIEITTDPPKVLTPDGELVGITPVTIDCLHKDIKVFWK